MPSSTAVATTVAYPFGPLEPSIPGTYSMLDLGEVNSVLNNHRAFLSKTKDRGTSLERTDREKRAQDRPSRSTAFSYICASNNALVTPPFTGSPTALDEGSAIGAVPEPLVDPKARKPDHRVSMGPEKAWSIGTTGESASSQDGQVEKSITEAITGAEPNARTSRKASHSLRFFKEGNPDEKGKRKDSRLGPHPREKLPPTAETADEAEGVVSRDNEGTSSRPVLVSDDKSLLVDRRARSFPIQTPESDSLTAPPEEYKSSRPLAGDVAIDEVSPSPEPVGPNRQAPESGEVVPDTGLETRRKSDASCGAGEITEEGEESGEEKISSAVFLPHQGLEQSEDHAPVTGVPPRSIPSSRTLPRANDWLEPIPDAGKQLRVSYEREAWSEPIDIPIVAREVDTQVDGPANADESEPNARPPPTLPHPVPEYPEDNVHEHQKQPLEAIELIPYKHQVGGHTTLWRFSRRAVCKQLNNRENEFYEKVEKYHRDLLAFLPRYIGVLNVTFQKKPRRKSTLKRDEAAALERSLVGQSDAGGAVKPNGTTHGDEGPHNNHADAPASASHQRVISQSLQTPSGSVPTVKFVDNQHILPRNLLQPSPSGPSIAGHYRSVSASFQEAGFNGHATPEPRSRDDALRPSLHGRQVHSWGATTVNKRLRNEVFNDAFLKRPIAIHRHRKGHQRAVPRRTLQQVLRPTGSDPTLIASRERDDQATASAVEQPVPISQPIHRLVQSPSDIQPGEYFEAGDDDEAPPNDVTGTSAPEPEILGDSSPAQKKKRRYSGTGLRRKPKDVRDARGDLKYFEEADEVGFKGDKGAFAKKEAQNEQPDRPGTPQDDATHDQQQDFALSAVPSSTVSGLPSPSAEFKRIPRPVNPKEAQTQKDSRVEFFLLLEDLTAGMKRPCIMDLKMGTRQYGVEANAKKQKSQQGKCAKTTSRELGVRVCGLQVWDVKTQSYVFKDKYYGRDLKKGAEFQGALTRFLYDGVDRASILRHIPTVLQKLDQLEVIISRLRGYRFYAASLLMFYDGEPGDADAAVIEDSTTDFATDTEEAGPRPRARKNPREIDFKMADFANCVTAGDLDKDKPCPPRHPGEPDRGFLRGLRSLRKYFLKIQRDTRADMGLISAQQQVMWNGGESGGELDGVGEDEGLVSG